MKVLIPFLLFLFVNDSFAQNTDTVKVLQSDSSIFRKNVSWIHRPCQKNPEWSVEYELISPKNNTYYLIYNKENQLVKEGLYTTTVIDEKKYSGILNAKQYSYFNNGKIQSIHYQENGRNLKRVVYNRRGKVKKTY